MNHFSDNIPMDRARPLPACPPILPSAILPFLLAALLALSACDDAFDPLTENQTEFFAIYGFLDSDADTQFVRVSPVRPLLDPSTRPIDTQVFSTRMGSSDRIAWRDSVVVLDDGTTGLLFYAPFRAERGARYLLEIRRADGEATTAITEVPAHLSLRIADLTQPFDIIQEVTWLGQQRQPARATIRYTVAPSPDNPPVVVTLPVSNPGRRTTGGWTFPINLSRDRNTVLRQLNRVLTDSSVVLFNLEMEIERRSIEWLTPDMPSNIQHGFGFFGSVATSTNTWTLDPNALREVGFAAPPEGLP